MAACKLMPWASTTRSDSGDAHARGRWRRQRELHAGSERGIDVEVVLEHARRDEVGGHLVEDAQEVGLGQRGHPTEDDAPVVLQLEATIRG